MVVVGNGVEELFYRVGQTSTYKPNGYYLSVGGLNFLDGGDRIIEIAQKLQQSNSTQQIWIAGNQHDPILLNKSHLLANFFLSVNYNLCMALKIASF